MRRFDPDAVITFGADGAYGHPDHVAISELTTAAFRALARDDRRRQRLYHAVFPPRPTSMAEEHARHGVLPPHGRSQRHRRRQPLDEGAASRPAGGLPVSWLPPVGFTQPWNQPA